MYRAIISSGAFWFGMGVSSRSSSHSGFTSDRFRDNQCMASIMVPDNNNCELLEDTTLESAPASASSPLPRPWEIVETFLCTRGHFVCESCYAILEPARCDTLCGYPQSWVDACLAFAVLIIRILPACRVSLTHGSTFVKGRRIALIVVVEIVPVCAQVCHLRNDKVLEDVLVPYELLTL